MQFGHEYRWVLKGYTPETLPMIRLAEYMREVGRLMGQEAAVRFVRVERGSVALVSKVQGGGAPGRVAARIDAVRRNSDSDALVAYNHINEMLTQDNTTAHLKRGSAVVIHFPGARAAFPERMEIKDHGTVVGYLYMLAQVGGRYQARLRTDYRSLYCSVDTLNRAADLGRYIFQDVRVEGDGLWTPERDGGWRALTFNIKNVIAVHKRTLREVVNELRDLDIEWPADPLSYINDMNEKVSGGYQ